MAKSLSASGEFPASLSGRVVFAAWCWVLSPLFFVAEGITRAAWTTPYSTAENYISDLGAAHCGTVTIETAQTYEAYVCSPLHPLMNGAYITVGLLALTGALAGRAAWPRGRAATSGVVLVGLAGVGAIIAGLFPEDVNLELHLLGALLAVPLSNIGMLLLALVLRRRKPWLAAYTGLTVLVGLTGLVLTGSPDSGIGIGLAERLAGYPFEAWKTVVAVVLLVAWRRSRRGVQETGTL
ncbi:DUF998 domain-containing protein [Streptomyces sp. HNM0574]|uniref:DUF998 domain-containing protein n=1 Tax=Streptomyces sp. HNM0574 TaxID=2714954 RepID=UPI00146D8586|nr:DUF998 domain-containing protein [Streptomyces sp. HNM0574]NLU66666.1 DUF998 domain-containing protein [Streptomyces sp. HNM0574]